ncbi:hypothetical protein BC832DRAFT_593960 [Gaertneriomyces semiglobifer]|nr:hypothetical protein BC832DRAFT_593960 [Gaertneriomyces semiglobifer]
MNRFSLLRCLALCLCLLSFNLQGVACQSSQLPRTNTFVPEPQFQSFADQISRAYATIPNPSAGVTKAVRDILSTAGNGPVDLAAVEYLIKQLESVVPVQDATYKPLIEANKDIAAAVEDYKAGKTPTTGPITVTFGPSPTSNPSGITTVVTTAVTSFSTSISGSVTSLVPVTIFTTPVTTVLTTPTGNAFAPPFQPTQNNNDVSGMTLSCFTILCASLIGLSITILN